LEHLTINLLFSIVPVETKQGRIIGSIFKSTGSWSDIMTHFPIENRQEEIQNYLETNTIEKNP